MAPSSLPSKSLPSVGRRTGWPAMMAVAAGGLIGSTARTGIGLWISTPTEAFPTGIALVNLLGSFLLGFYLARRERAITSRRWSLQFWGIGVLGSFTTFSTFSIDLVQLLAAGRLSTATAHLGISVLGGLLLALAGQRIGTALP